MEISSHTEQYKQDDLWLKLPFNHLAGVAQQWSKSYSQSDVGLSTSPLDLSSINEKTFSVHHTVTTRDTEESAKQYIRLNEDLKQRFPERVTSEDPNYKIQLTGYGTWEVFWEIESPFDSEQIEDIKNKYGDYIVSLFQLNDRGLDFTHTANPERGSSDTAKGVFAINKKDNTVIVLVEMTKDNKYGLLMVPQLEKLQPAKLQEAQKLWKAFMESYKEKGFGHINQDTAILVHAQTPTGDKNFFVAEFDNLLL